MNEMILARENITKLFFRYTIPTIVGMAVLGLNTIVDGFFVGRYIGATALACVNIALPFSSLLLALSIVVGIGMLTVIGRLLGAGERAAAQDAFHTALLLIGGISGVIALAALVAPLRIAALLGAPPELLATVGSYIRIVGALLPFLGLIMVFDYALKIIGKPLYAMVALIVAVGGHMALNYLFIARLGWGLDGAAWATGLGYLLAAASAWLPFAYGQLGLTLSDGRFRTDLAKEILYNGSSEGIGEVGVGITAFLFNVALLRYVGPAGVAAFSAVGYLSMVGVNMMLGIADGVSSIISYNYGQGRTDRVLQTLKLSTIAVLTVGVLLFAAIRLAGPALIELFIAPDEAGVYNFAVAGAKLYAYAFLINGLNIVASGYFTAIGSPKQAALIALGRGALWVAAALALLAPLYGAAGIWLAVPAAELMTLLLSIVLLYQQWLRGEFALA